MPSLEQLTPQPMEPAGVCSGAHDDVFISLPTGRDHAAEAEGAREGARGAAGERPALKRHRWHARPQCVRASGVRVVPPVVHHEVGERADRHKVGIGHLPREAQAPLDAVRRGLGTQACLSKHRRPERGVREPAQCVCPRVERVRIHLVQLVEVAQRQAAKPPVAQLQAEIAARDGRSPALRLGAPLEVRRRGPRVSAARRNWRVCEASRVRRDEVRVGEVGHPLREIAPEARRRGGRVELYVVHLRQRGRARVAIVRRLDGRRPVLGDGVPGPGGMADQVEQHMHTGVADRPRRLSIGEERQVVELVRRSRDLPAHRGAGVPLLGYVGGKANELEPCAGRKLLQPRQHRPADGVLAKVGREKAEAQPAAPGLAAQTTARAGAGRRAGAGGVGPPQRRREGRGGREFDILASAVGGDAPPGFVRDWPHQRVEGRQASVHPLARSGAQVPETVVLLQVALQQRQPRLALPPVAHELLRVEQRVQRRPELRVDFEGVREGGYSLARPAHLDEARAKILVRLAQRWLERDGLFIALGRLSMEPELLEASAQVGVGLGKCGHQPCGLGVVVAHLLGAAGHVGQRVA
eukprot:scaffold627_cov123-Isochrysis_galbana.AAC.6